MKGISQSHGTPIRAATKRGFRSVRCDPSSPSVGVIWAWREAADWSPSPPDCGWLDGLSPPDVPSCAFGVGHILTCTVSEVAAVRLPPIRSFIARCADGDFWSSRATGVPHIRARPTSVGSPRLFPPPAIVVVGVCQEPESSASMRGTNVGRGEQTPFRIEPEVGKIGEDVREPGPNKSGDVLQEHASRSHVTDDPSDGRPEPPVIVNAPASTGSRERLARESRRDNLNETPPCRSVERGEVVPDWSVGKPPLKHSCGQDGSCVGVSLNPAHRPHSDGLKCERETPVPITEVEHSHRPPPFDEGSIRTHRTPDCSCGREVDNRTESHASRRRGRSPTASLPLGVSCPHR